MAEEVVPSYILDYTRALGSDPVLDASDQLAFLATRLSEIRSAFLHGSMSHTDLITAADTLERDLLIWSKNHSITSSPCAFQTIADAGSPYAWHGTRHIYRCTQARNFWNQWRLVRILLSRTQEALWRRSWPVLASPERPIPATERFRLIRIQMTSDLCTVIANELGCDTDAAPAQGSVASGLLLAMPLLVAATCMMEQLAESTVSPSGSRLIHCNRALHLDPFNSSSTQLAWMVGRMDFISQTIGVRWAGAGSSFVKGNTDLCYDLCRS